jgi:hypothetical protein
MLGLAIQRLKWRWAWWIQHELTGPYNLALVLAGLPVVFGLAQLPVVSSLVWPLRYAVLAAAWILASDLTLRIFVGKPPDPK